MPFRVLGTKGKFLGFSPWLSMLLRGSGTADVWEVYLTVSGLHPWVGVRVISFKIELSMIVDNQQALKAFDFSSKPNFFGLPSLRLEHSIFQFERGFGETSNTSYSSVVVICKLRTRLPLIPDEWRILRRWMQWQQGWLSMIWELDDCVCLMTEHSRDCCAVSCLELPNRHRWFREYENKVLRKTGYSFVSLLTSIEDEFPCSKHW